MSLSVGRVQETVAQLRACTVPAEQSRAKPGRHVCTALLPGASHEGSVVMMKSIV